MSLRRPKETKVRWIWERGSRDWKRVHDMAEVDLNDETLKRFAVFHHRFDPITNHFRWFGIIAFDNEREFSKYFKAVCVELDARHEANEAHYKEQFAGRILEPASIQKKFPGHSAYREIGAL